MRTGWIRPMREPRVGDVVRLTHRYGRVVPAGGICVVVDHGGGVWVLQSLTTGRKAFVARSYLDKVEILSDDT